MAAAENPGSCAYGAGSPEQGGAQQKIIRAIIDADRVPSGDEKNKGKAVDSDRLNGPATAKRYQQEE